MKEMIDVEVESITKIETEKKEGEDTVTFKAMMKEAGTETPRTLSISSPEEFDFEVGSNLKITVEDAQKKISEYNK